jgi:hypothetical protein
MIRVNRGVIEQALREGQPLVTFTERAVGKTTGAILLALAKSYYHPGTDIRIEDPDVETASQRTFVRAAAERIISLLGYANIKVSIVGQQVVITNNFSEVLVK